MKKVLLLFLIMACSSICFASSFLDEFDGTTLNPFWTSHSGMSVSGGMLGGINGYTQGSVFNGSFILETQMDVHTADNLGDVNYMSFSIKNSTQSVGMEEYTYKDPYDGAKYRYIYVIVDGVVKYSASISGNGYYKIVYISPKTVQCYTSVNRINWTLRYTQNYSVNFIPTNSRYNVYSNAPDRSNAYFFQMKNLGGSGVKWF